MELTINVSNPQAITYDAEELGFTILGGIRLEGLDRMRVWIIYMQLVHPISAELVRRACSESRLLYTNSTIG